MRRRRIIQLGLGAGAVMAGTSIWRVFSGELARARARVGTGSQVFASRFGAMEYAVAGDGPPVIMVHGTGGGFDQGMAFGAPLVAAHRQIIAPSRFGYLRSAFPPDPSDAAQADALADLMDERGMARAPVIGGSAGARAALQFAIRHPGRCSALVAVVPAAFAPGRIPPPPPNAVAHFIIEQGLRSDFLFWAGLAAAEDSMIGALLATDPALVHAADPQERARVLRMLHDILPVSQRARGLLHDAAVSAAPPPMKLEEIVAPTLVVSLEDDRFGTLAPARHIAASVRGAELVVYPTGGHVWVDRNQDLFTRIRRFLA